MLAFRCSARGLPYFPMAVIARLTALRKASRTFFRLSPALRSLPPLPTPAVSASASLGQLVLDFLHTLVVVLLGFRLLGHK